ncbi:protein NipSnap homolog 3B-like isoform X2 [Sphaerodactylus townsendi]|uniref:protein NipSnap homolog 3B-like isoform X2 n=1 Tax=Sphaerodactylus townsendi TaxID=933632 RepID=UPI002025DA8D|nr:protein NipSnap homolog 3B-like isoform X2 [Sphaerodactylus townsendi]
MMRFPPLLRRTAVFQPTLYQACRSPLATGPRQDSGTIFELRTYDIKPEKTKEFMELVSRNIHIRTVHSEMIGFWTAELGSMNKAFHIWKYDNFAHRAAARKAVVSDKEWQEKLSAILPLLKTQDMEIAYLVPWCKLGTPPGEGVYELVTYQQKPGGPALWGQSFKAAIDAHVSKSYATLIGVFHTEYGMLNTVHVLWWHKDPDTRAAGRHRAHEDARVVAAVRESVQFLESQRNMILIAAPFSPLK